MAIREASPHGHYGMLPAGGDRRAPWAAKEAGSPEPPKPRLLDRVRQAIRTRHYSRRTEKAYVHWIKRYIFFHGKRHPAEMGVELRATSRGFILVTVAGADLLASVEVAHIGVGDGLNAYWADLAENWRGWSGEKTWRSIEGDLGFSATSDRTGHVTLKVTLAYRAPWRWQTQAILAIEAGQLDGFAARALAFARYLDAAA